MFKPWCERGIRQEAEDGARMGYIWPLPSPSPPPLRIRERKNGMEMGERQEGKKMNNERTNESYVTGEAHDA